MSLLVAAGHVENRLNDICARHDITGDQYNVLRILRGAHPNGYPRKEIIGRLMNRAPDVTRLQDRLERRGLIRRSCPKEDRRLCVATITEKGLRLLDSMAPEIETAHTRFARELSPGDLRELTRILGQVIPEE